MTKRCESHTKLLEPFTQAFPAYLVHFRVLFYKYVLFQWDSRLNLQQLIENILKSIILCSNIIIMLVHEYYNAGACINMTDITSSITLLAHTLI